MTGPDGAQTPPPGRPHLSVAEWATVIAAVVAVPPVVGWGIERLTAPGLEVIAPAGIELRADLPLAFHPGCDDASARCAPRNPAEAGAQALRLIAPVSYVNTGESGETVFIRHEDITLEDRAGVRLGTWRAVHDTELLPVSARHWWYGDIRAWVPVALDGGDARSQQVVFAPREGACDGCSFGAMLDTLGQRHRDLEPVFLRLRLETAGQGGFEARCRLDLGDLIGPYDQTDPATRDFYRRPALCAAP